ncbi:hypothetical protein V1527DRAFT_473290 [Lipomyces starkeyi]
MSRVRSVILETYRQPREDFTPETLLEASQSFTIVENVTLGMTSRRTCATLCSEIVFPAISLAGKKFGPLP